MSALAERRQTWPTTENPRLNMHQQLWNWAKDSSSNLDTLPVLAETKQPKKFFFRNKLICGCDWCFMSADETTSAQTAKWQQCCCVVLSVSRCKMLKGSVWLQNDNTKFLDESNKSPKNEKRPPCTYKRAPCASMDISPLWCHLHLCS